MLQLLNILDDKVLQISTNQNENNRKRNIFLPKLITTVLRQSYSY